MTKIINLYGGPGTGKSTTAAHVFALLKHKGINTELVTEYAKDKVWENSLPVLDDQIYVFAKQYHRVYRLLNQVDYIVTDAPLLLGMYYGKKHGKNYLGLVEEVYNSMDNIDIFLGRLKAYQPKGRLQTEAEAKLIDEEILGILRRHSKFFNTIPADVNAAEEILNIIGGLNE